MCADKKTTSSGMFPPISDPVAGDMGDTLKGKMLIAMPDMGDARFDRAVIVMLEHGHDGAMGIVINKSLDAIDFPELLEQLEIPVPEDKNGNPVPLPHHPVHFGGPVELGRGFILHSPDVMLDHSLPLGNLAVTTSLEMLALMANDVGPKQSFFCLGYTGWSAGQLENEIKQNAWLYAPLDPEILFKLPYDARWDAAMALAGVNPDYLSSTSGSA